VRGRPKVGLASSGHGHVFQPLLYLRQQIIGKGKKVRANKEKDGEEGKGGLSSDYGSHPGGASFHLDGKSSTSRKTAIIRGGRSGHTAPNKLPPNKKPHGKGWAGDRNSRKHRTAGESNPPATRAQFCQPGTIRESILTFPYRGKLEQSSELKKSKL